MNLNRIIKNLKIVSMVGSDDIEICDIVYDSRKVKKNTLFVCLCGDKYNGNDFVSDAVSMGAVAIISDKPLNIVGVTVIRVGNAREALAHISANFFGNPSEKIKTVGITGTKGKTTTSFMIKSILESSNSKVGVIGTMGVIIGDENFKTPNTTPESYEIQKYLNLMVEKGCEYAVMEASSIGLINGRLNGITFDCGVFTNFSHDHIGGSEHKDMEEYIYAKSLLFQKCNMGFINSDDPFAEKVTKNHTCAIQTFGFEKNCDYRAFGEKLLSDGGKIGIGFSVDGKIDIQNASVPIPGKFNIYNALAAICVCNYMNKSDENILRGLSITTVRGRVERVEVFKGYSVFIDYAHNALSIKSVLETLKEYKPHRLITLFGAGGNRPKLRRYEMGEAVGNISDFSVITSDNPRFENPADIIKDIEKGIKKTSGKYIVIEDRKKAIEYCLKNAMEGDIIVLAGKGHEDYQEIKGVKYPFDERLIIYDILKKLNINESRG